VPGGAGDLRFLDASAADRRSALEFIDPPLRQSLPAVAHDMAQVGLEDDPLTATAALVWNGDLPRPLQQILFAAAGL
jgi:hypothetical protein